MPLTLRLAYHSVRSVFRAAVLFFLAWLFLIPATAEEKTTLGVRVHEQYPDGLRPMRTARAVIAIAPDQAYTVMAMAAGPDITPLVVRIIMVQLASGQRPQQSAPATPTIESDRAIEGPRFIQVD